MIPSLSIRKMLIPNEDKNSYNNDIRGLNTRLSIIRDTYTGEDIMSKSKIISTFLLV